MKKMAIFAAAAAFIMISGCNASESQDNVTGSQSNQTPQPADITYIRWGMESVGHNDGNIPFEKLNKRLESEGSNIRVEAVELDMGYDDSVSFDTHVKEYEKENGSFDILTYGSDWESKHGSVSIFIENGYFRELSEEDKAQFTDVPDICWSAGKVNGKHYTVPSLCFGLSGDVGNYFYFNAKYISEDKLKDFGGTVEEIENILDEITLNEETTGLDYYFDYLGFTNYFPASQKGGLYLSDKTMRAANPYEDEDVIKYARTLNSIYRKGYINYDINFSEWDMDKEHILTDFAILTGDGKGDEDEIKRRLGKDYEVFTYFQPYYMENRLLKSTGIPTASAHPIEAMELLKRLHADKELSGVLTKQERRAIGLPEDNETVNADNVKLSPFVNFELKYTDYDITLMEMLSSSFDRLCKSEDFDAALAEINAELKAAGIDEYVDKVNKLLEESNAASGQ